jgi:hypothetical protein
MMWQLKHYPQVKALQGELARKNRKILELQEEVDEFKLQRRERI